MPKETKQTIEITQKIVLPSCGDNETDQELIDNFLSHSDEEYKQMGKEIEEAERDEEENLLKKQNEGGQEAFTNFSKNIHVCRPDGNYEILGDVEGSNLEFERDKRIVERKGKIFDLNTQSGEKDFMVNAFGVMKSSDIAKMLSILGEIFGDNTMSKIHEYLSIGTTDDNGFIIIEKTL